jgi:uroporphyrinogen-III synthase
MRIVLTRPHNDSERTAAALRARGHDVLIAPLLRIETLPVALHDRYGGVVITSANAAAAIAGLPARSALTSLPLYAVGKRSADAASDAGFSDIHVAGGDASDLVRLIAEHRPDAEAPLLYLAGEDRSADLTGDLAVHGVAVELAVIYRAVPQPFPAELMAAVHGEAVDAVMHFSKRSAAQYVTGARDAGIAGLALVVRQLCLSEQVAAPLREAGAVRIDVAKRPDESAMIALTDQAAA